MEASSIKSNTGRREAISSLYVLKAICAFIVVACHSPMKAFPMPFHDIAVPCFFMITGYFLYSEDVAKTVKKAFQNAKKVLGILLFFTCVYFVVDPSIIKQ